MNKRNIKLVAAKGFQVDGCQVAAGTYAGVEKRITSAAIGGRPALVSIEYSITIPWGALEEESRIGPEIVSMDLDATSAVKSGALRIA